MGNKVVVRHYFLEAFTPKGYFTLLPELLKRIKSTYLLSGGPGTGKSTMIKLIGIELIDRGYDVDYIRSVRNPDSVAGLCLPKNDICLLDKKEFNIEKVKENDEKYRIINFENFCRENKLKNYSDRIKELEHELKILEKGLMDCLKDEYGIGENNTKENGASLKVINESSTNEKNRNGKENLAEILLEVKKSNISFCFLHALNVDGWLNIAPRYLKDYDRICLDFNDSTKVVKDIYKEIKCLGQVVEIVIHPLRTDTVMGLIFPSKNLAVWQGNPSDVEEQGLKKKHSSVLEEQIEKYRIKRVQIKSIYNKTVNFSDLDELRNEFTSSILADLRG
ncbi:MAG: hypothetical protein WCR27_00500 [Eubacteriales bacterium]